MAPMPHRFAQPERTYAVKPKYKVSRSQIVLFMGLSLTQIYYKKTPLLTGFFVYFAAGATDTSAASDGGSAFSRALSLSKPEISRKPSKRAIKSFWP